jgi:hypothetical protein
MAVKTFQVSTEYDRQAADARKRRRMADLLAQQVIEPTQYGPGPTPAAAPLVQGLQAFLAARAGRKADEAEETALEAKTRAEREAAQQVAATGSQIAGRLMGGAPVRDIAPPDASGLGEVAIESRYRKDPEGALAIGMTQRGGEAISKAPLLAAMLANQMKEPTSAAPKTAAQDTMQWNPKTQRWEDIPGAVSRIRDIAAAKRPDVVVTGGGRNEPLVTVKGEDGNPILVPRSQAAGMTPYSARTAAQEIADVDRQRAIDQKTIDTQAALDNIEELLAHPGRISGTGASSFVSIVPGTAARGFQAQLETFKARTFIPMVSALKGMGALSDAEGKKLSAAVGALDPSMPEQEFERELRKIQKTLYEKARASGLNVVMPEGLGDKAVDLPPPGAVRRKN